jgi:hypothetical protein
MMRLRRKNDTGIPSTKSPPSQAFAQAQNRSVPGQIALAADAPIAGPARGEIAQRSIEDLM